MKKLVMVIMMVMAIFTMTVEANAFELPKLTKTEVEEFELFNVEVRYEKEIFETKWHRVEETWVDPISGMIILVKDGDYNIVYDNEKEWMRSIGIRFNEDK